MTQPRSACHDWAAAQLPWSDWISHEGSWIGDRLPTAGGVYRIRVRGADSLVYIGQTGTGSMNLKRRMSMLKAVYGPEMPYRDPHTAGPALWALRHRDRCEFEVSVVTSDGDAPWRAQGS